MRETTRRPGAQADPEAPQSASDADGAGGAGDAQQAARQQRAHKRREAAHDAEADAFNQRHAAEAAEFNQLTKDACLGEDGKLDAAAVKEWQREHNVAPDGKVGPKTIAAAGGKADGARDAADAKLAPPAVGDKVKPKGPIEEIASWLDLETALRMIREFEKATHATPKADAKAAPGATAEEAKQESAGLASQLSVDHFVAAAKKIEAESEWKKLKPEQRAQHMVNAANVQLGAAGVRQIKWIFGDDLAPTSPASFAHTTWDMKLYKPLLSAKKLTREASVNLADSVYHEARHAEQNYRIAQMLAGRHDTPENIFQMTGIDKKTIADAAQKPLDGKSVGAAKAQALFDDKYGGGSDHHGATEKDAKAKVEAYAVVQRRAENPSASAEEKEAAQKELAAMKPDVMAAWQAYQALPTEADALAVGDQARSQMSGK